MSLPTRMSKIDSVNVVCLKWGSLYGPEYVNTLFSMISRHVTLPFRFICFTEDSVGLASGIDVQPLPEFTEPAYKYARYCSAWRKLALFKRGLAGMQGKVLFLDLDVVIVDNINEVFGFSDQFAMIENWYQKGQRVGQASAMCFDAGAPEHLLQRYLDNPIQVLEQYRTEQAYIAGELKPYELQFFPETWFQSFKKHCMPQGIRRFSKARNLLPETAKVIVFHGRPNPPDAIRGDWGKPVAWYKRWYKYVRPTEWVAEHWR